MKSSKKRSRAVVTVVACILAVCLVAALVLFSLVNSKVRALQKGATFEFSYNITAQDSASTPALYNILKQVGATSGDVAGLYSPGQLQLYLYPSGGLARAETGGTDFFTDLYIDANDTYFDAGRLYRTLRDSIADSAPLVGAFLPEWSLPNYITQAQLAKILGVPNTQVAMQEMSGYTLTLSRQCVVHPDYAKKDYTYYQFPSEGEDAAVLVVGLPLNMDGTEGERARKSRKLAKTVEIWSGLPVRMWDERQSTCEAADILDEVGTFGAHRKAILDSVSATVILEDYLAWRKEHPGEM